MLTCEGNNDKNLCGDHVSVSKQAKNIKILSNQGVFVLTIEFSTVGLKTWLGRVWWIHFIFQMKLLK